MRNSCAYEGVNGVNLRDLRLLQLWLLRRLVLLFVCSPILALSRRLVPPSTLLNVRHLLQIVVLSLQRLALSEQSPRVRMKSPHEHGRTAGALEFLMRI
jgi:hypothetical protein